MIAEFFACPVIKYGAIVLAVVLLISGTLFAIGNIYGKGERTGASGVTCRR